MGQGLTQGLVSGLEGKAYLTYIEFNTDGQPLYVGLALPGSATSDSVWQIKKVNYDTDGNPTSVQYANGSADFSFVWDDRSTYF